jgi:hypothetical protein
MSAILISLDHACQKQFPCADGMACSIELTLCALVSSPPSVVVFLLQQDTLRMAYSESCISPRVRHATRTGSGWIVSCIVTFFFLVPPFLTRQSTGRGLSPCRIKYPVGLFDSLAERRGGRMSEGEGERGITIGRRIQVQFFCDSTSNPCLVRCERATYTEKVGSRAL